MGVIDVYTALGGHSDVTDAVGASEPPQRVLAVHGGWSAYVLDDFGYMTDAVQSDASGIEEGFGKDWDFTFVIYDEAKEGAPIVTGADHATCLEQAFFGPVNNIGC
jgi:hypothetical protein